MKKTDHLQIGRLLLEQNDVNVRGARRLLFLFGCVEPDINPFTYTRGLFRHEFMHGHHAENSLSHRHKLMRSLTKSGVRSPWQWFSFGTLIHYSVDSFTFAHNTIFPGTMKDHIRYESNLHTAFCDYVSGKKRRREPIRGIRSLDKLHDHYIHGEGAANRDCRFIMRSVKWLWRIMPKYAR